MSSSGPLAPTSTGQTGSGVAWDSPHFILADDGTPCEADFVLSGDANSTQLESGFTFAIPAGAIVQGIVLEIRRKGSDVAMAGGDIWDSLVKLLKSGAAVGSSKASATPWPTSFAYATYGSSSDLWGTTWTAAEINGSFGARQIAQNIYTDSNDAQAYVDHHRITVYYSEPSGGGMASMTGVG